MISRAPLCALIILISVSAGIGAPVIYATDLFHPHVDPDDHFDLATLFSLRDLQVQAVLLDQGKRQLQRPGAIPLRQMLAMTKRQVPTAIGLGDPLSSPADDGRAQSAEFQGAVVLLEKVLRETREPVTIMAAGSVRDICAAWNRYPELLKEKVGRLYLNIGTAIPGGTEYNVDLDPHAYVGILRSGLPIYLCPCMPMDRKNSNAVYSTWWHFRQEQVLESAPRPLQNFFIYALQRPAPEELDPLKALNLNLSPWRRLIWEMDRNMWCTGPLLHAAGRMAPNPTFEFVPARIELDARGRTVKLSETKESNLRVFKVRDAAGYERAMQSSLLELLRNW